MAVKRARVDPASPVLDPSSVRQLGLVLSRFEFNGLPNPNYRPGKFSLKVRAEEEISSVSACFAM